MFCIIVLGMLITFFSCRKLQVVNCTSLIYRKDKKELIDKIFYWLENDSSICVYNSLTKRSLARYDIYTFSTLANSFAFRRLVYNLKNYNNGIKCKNERKMTITCWIIFRDAKIPLFFVRGKTEYIDEKTGKVKKENRILLDLDFDYYLILLDDIKRKYNIDLFYDYYRKRN